MFENINTNEFSTENISVENPSEESLRRDTYLVTNAKPQSSCKSNLYPSNSKVDKPASKPIAIKAKKVVVSKKKLSPVSGNIQ